MKASLTTALSSVLVVHLVLLLLVSLLPSTSPSTSCASLTLFAHAFQHTSRAAKQRKVVTGNTFSNNDGRRNNNNNMVHLHGRTTLHVPRRARSATAALRTSRISPSTHAVGERPPDPSTLLNSVDHAISTLSNWFHNKSNILVITGAGISTESGVPDYRGSSGSYHRGHKPMVHDQFMSLESQRKRYWGRSMAGWRSFANAMPNDGHLALAELERMGHVGVEFVDKEEYYHPDEAMNFLTASSDGVRHEAIITQNVDGLHEKAGSTLVTNLHGRNDRLRCMECGSFHCRHDYQNQLDDINREWLEDLIRSENIDNRQGSSKEKLRADGDAYIEREDYSSLIVPSCSKCHSGFVKPDVVFFGDTVPRHRVERCYAAVDAADGLLCVGSSLAVHSAYRFVQAAERKGTPIAILNVGETRAEANDLQGVTKIEAPAGAVLQGVAKALA